MPACLDMTSSALAMDVGCTFSSLMVMMDQTREYSIRGVRCSGVTTSNTERREGTVLGEEEREIERAGSIDVVQPAQPAEEERLAGHEAVGDCAAQVEPSGLK